MQKHWRKGYATEAAQACVNYGFTSLKLEEIVGRVMPENLASIAVLKKVGMTFWKEGICIGQPTSYYIIKRLS